MSTNSVYNAAAREVQVLFDAYLEGGAERPVFVLSSGPLGPDARVALQKSFLALGFTGNTCTCATLTPALSPSHDSSTGAAPKLDAQAVFMLIEGLDPLYVIATDAGAVQLLGQAYRTEYRLDSLMRVFGRQGVGFANLDSLLQTEAGKRKTWELLKQAAARQ